MDRISSLPDEILEHILSFLSTKEAALTSSLSTRWKNVFVFVPSLHLDYARQHGGLQVITVVYHANFH